MKLISCYITGFGTIKEWSYDFSDGMNALCQEMAGERRPLVCF